MSDILEIADLHLSLRDGSRRAPILRGVSLELPAGTIHGLVGESGGGKTMVAKAVLGILPPGAETTSGSIRFEGRDLLAMGAFERRALLGRSIAMILQNPMTALNPVYRIEGQVTDVMRLHLGLDATSARERALALLHDVHIREPERVLRLYPHELSGGMCQRIAICIAFACRPRLIIADEPTTALDVTVQHQILRLLKELQAKTGTSVLFITHDLGVVAKVCDAVSVLHAGRVLESGPVARVFASQAHEYTSALLDAAPRYDRPGDMLRPIPAALHERLMREAADYDRSRENA